MGGDVDVSFEIARCQATKPRIPNRSINGLSASHTTDAPPSHSTDREFEWLALIGFFGPLLWSACFIFAASVANPGFSHIREPISHLADSQARLPWIMQIAFVGYGLFTLPVAIAARRALSGARFATVVWILFALYALASVAAGFFRADPDMPATTFSGEMHSIISQAVASLVVLTAISVGIATRRLREWDYYPETSIALGVCALPFVALFVLDIEPQYLGLWQRCFMGITLVWLMLTSWSFARMTPMRRRLKQAAATGHRSRRDL